MPDWDDIFTEKGKVFLDPHPNFERLVSIFKEYQVKRVLDVGCGTGRHVIHLAKNDFEVYGFDASPKAIDLTRQWLDELGLQASVQLLRMEEPFPYNDEFFDAVISIQTIHHNVLGNIRATILEIDRVVRPHGLLFITVPTFQVGPIPTEKDWKLRPIEKGTYIPEAGPESGIPHHYFSCTELIHEFHSFDPLEIFIDETNHRAFLGVKRKRQ